MISQTTGTVPHSLLAQSPNMSRMCLLSAPQDKDTRVCWCVSHPVEEYVPLGCWQARKVFPMLVLDLQNQLTGLSVASNKLHTDLHTHRAVHIACFYRQRGSWELSKNSINQIAMTLPWSLALWNCGETYCGENKVCRRLEARRDDRAGGREIK